MFKRIDTTYPELPFNIIKKGVIEDKSVDENENEDKNEFKDFSNFNDDFINQDEIIENQNFNNIFDNDLNFYELELKTKRENSLIAFLSNYATKRVYI